MEYRPLGRTGIAVSVICLGTMTWGRQNSEAEGHGQMDYALDRGVTFWDTAEMYPIPRLAEAYGRTEEIIGTWLRSRGGRDRVVVATKLVGRGSMPWVKRGAPVLSRADILQALDDSLRRLQTDYVDLYQIHWPARATNVFGQLGFAGSGEDDTVPLEEQLGALGELVASGKVRAVGLSNETAWGAMRFLALAEAGGGPRMASIQNPYGLLNRSFEVGLAEVALREECGLLAYSPLGMGMLTGKYLDGAAPGAGRLTLFPEFQRYRGPSAVAAAEAYVKLAREAGLKPAHMALAFVNSRPFLTSTIIGATTLEQLAENIDSQSVRLEPALLERIEAIHRIHTYPAP